MRKERIGFLELCGWFLFAVLPVYAGEDIYAGRWDSHMYQSLDHPKTIALRVEVEDDDTGMPLAGVRVSVEGEWEKEKRWGGVITAEFELGAVTDRKGIAVFGLSWNDSRGGKKDDIEKVSQVLVRRDGYQQVSRRISFSSLVRTSTVTSSERHATPPSASARPLFLRFFQGRFACGELTRLPGFWRERGYWRGADWPAPYD